MDLVSEISRSLIGIHPSLWLILSIKGIGASIALIRFERCTSAQKGIILIVLFESIFITYLALFGSRFSPFNGNINDTFYTIEQVITIILYYKNSTHNKRRYIQMLVIILIWFGFNRIVNSDLLYYESSAVSGVIVVFASYGYLKRHIETSQYLSVPMFWFALASLFFWSIGVVTKNLMTLVAPSFQSFGTFLEWTHFITHWSWYLILLISILWTKRT